MPRIDIPEIFEQLFVPTTINGKPVRYRVAHSGRGAAKTWTFARMAIVKAMEKKRLIVCCREIQRSIEDSVYQLLCNQIKDLGFQDFFKITNKDIIGKNGSKFIFKGLYRNVDSIKSLEGADIAWLNEGENVSEETLQILLPTIRQDDAEIWIEFNPKYADQPVYDRFVVNTPDNCITIRVNWRDNPYFNEVLKAEKDSDYHYRPHDAKQIWEGDCIAAGGKIWTDFNRTIHAKEFDMKEIKRNANFFMGMDPAAHYYPACIWIALIPHGERYIKWVYDEYPKFETFNSYFCDIRNKIHDTMSIQEKAKQFFLCDGTAEFGIKISKRFMDTRFAKGTGDTNAWTGMSIVKEYAKPENGGMLFELPSEKIIDIQRNVIKQDMQYNTLMEIGLYNQPTFYVSPRCKNLIQSLMNHRLEEDSEREDSRYKDFSDALRICYAGISTTRWQDPNPNKRPANYNYLSSPSSDGWMA